MLRNVLLHDKHGQIRTDFLEVVPLNTSFCQFVLREGLFQTNNSALDPRLNGNPHQGIVICYHGVPMMGGGAELMGTLCHFDLVGHSISDSEFDLLTQAGSSLPDFVPPARAGVLIAEPLEPPV
ncbi:GAF domain-containing protein [Variovorax sp. ZS18.2.2]|uniref:GAF domain-containing protein n=1 Tax=Variovorax sp. ZS18.2.2 TaxID=2971255 RepID=UPI002150B0B5|nr:GAF domain-containing protein [Variovorax sp. ZS18.2.2]MCR6478423.1 GAF domain-containing protein [Variovorax sp. ZS18.2.2]